MCKCVYNMIFWSESRGDFRDAPRAGAPLPWEQAGRAGNIQPGERKAPGRPWSSH